MRRQRASVRLFGRGRFYISEAVFAPGPVVRIFFKPLRRPHEVDDVAQEEHLYFVRAPFARQPNEVGIEKVRKGVARRTVAAGGAIGKVKVAEDNEHVRGRLFG